eukprot:SAG22_NODE_472_length_10094_cov_6.762581_3_plen_279_part_00
MTSMSGKLSPAQIQEFKREGVLTLPDFIAPAQLADWRGQVLSGLGSDNKLQMPAPLTPTPGELPQFQALMEQLGDGHFTGGGAQIAPIFRSTDPAGWKLPEAGHIDGYNGIWSGTGANRVSCTFYLNDVAEKGGCFTYWRGGHKRFHAFARQHPEQIDGRFTKTPEYEQSGNGHAYKGGGGTGTQHAAKAGTVCLWHGWCPHQASSNANETPRLAIISRWADKRFTGPAVKFGFGADVEAGWDSVDEDMRKHPRWDIPEDLWRDWGAAVRSSGGGARL